jgi:hypothetical protein
MRSKELAVFKNKLSEFNTHYSHFLFISEQFSIDNLATISQNPDKFTDDIFPKNSFAPQFKVPLSEFSSEFENTVNFFRKSIFLLSYFQFEVYLKELYSFGQKYKENVPEIKPRISAITQIISNFELNNSNCISEEELKTVEYFRLRRNATVHRKEGVSYKGEYADHIKKYGKELDRFWSDHSLTLKSFSFCGKNQLAEEFSQNDIFDTLNIIRRIAEKIDVCFTEKIIGEKNLLLLVKEQFLENYTPDKIKKFCHLSLIEFGIKIEHSEAKEIIGV